MHNISFQAIPQSYESNIAHIGVDSLKNSYSRFNFKYFNFTSFYKNTNNCDKNTIVEQFEIFLHDYLSIFKLIIYHKTNPMNKNELGPNNTEFCDIVICVENQCIIIEELNLSVFNKIIIKLKEQQKIIINVTINDKNTNENNIEQIKEEIHNFCKQYKFVIMNNEFVCKTIQSIVGYLIRRYFYPTNYFKDKSFFDFYQSQNSNERMNRSEFIDLINTKSLQHQNLLQMKERIKRNQDKINIQNFKENDFIILRTIHSNSIYIFYLVIHIETLHVFLMKEIIHPDEVIKEVEHEKYFCENYSHRCLCHFYGFIIKNGTKIGFIYEFMSNGSLGSYITSNRSKISESFSLIAISRIFQGIEYLHSHSLIHRDIKPSNILLDHDFIPYICDYETIRRINEDERNIKTDFTNNIGSSIYISPEQFIGKRISYPTDIFSFGLIIFFIYEAKKDEMLQFLSKEKNYKIQFKSKISNNLQSIIKNCIKIYQENRLKLDEIKPVLIDEIRLTIYQEILSFKQIDDIIYESFFLEIENTTKFFNFILFIFSLKEEENKSNALLKMGDVYYFGRGVVQQNYLNAKKYYELSSKLKNSIALIKLGNLFENGLGVQRDYLKAKYYYEQSAKLNDSNALINLGNLFENGLGVEQNYAKAKEYYELSAKQNNSNAFIFLGNLYYFGCGVKRNYEKAKENYELSKKFNNSYAFNHLGYLYLKCFGVEKDYPKAKFYFEKSAKLNNSYALYNLGNVYLKGFGVDKNYALAKDYFEQSAKLNNSDALIKIGNLYLRGLGVEKDYLIAKRYYEWSANQNNPDALFKIGNLYLKGNGVKTDYLKAIQFFDLASQNKNLDSLFFLADLYSCGEIFDVDNSKAIQYFQRSTKIQYEKIRIVNNIDNFPYYKWVNNHYYYHSHNDLGLIYFTVYNNIDKTTQYIKIAAFGEYPYGQNNFGLLNEFYFNRIENAEYMYNKSSKHQFALASFNLGHLKEKNGKITESIEHYIKASNDEDAPLMFHNRKHYDKRLEISKTFIICMTNLKLSEYYFSKSDFAESKKYFIKSFEKLTKNKFKFTIMKMNFQSIFIHLQQLILNHPSFNLINQPSFNKVIKLIVTSNKRNDLVKIETSNQTIIKMSNKRHYSENDISIDNKKINNCLESEKFISNEKEIKYNITSSEYNQKEDNFNSKNKTDDEITFESTSQIFDFIIKNQKSKAIFSTEIRKIINLMNSMIYTPPYHILFGRINIENPKPKKKNLINPNAKEINQSFYDGFNG